MDISGSQYLKEVDRNLDCPQVSKKVLIGDLEHDIKSFLADNPDATAAEIAQALGPPRDVANTLMEAVDSQTLKSYRTFKKVRLTLIFTAVFVLLISLAFLVVHMAQEKSVPVSETNTVVINSAAMPSSKLQ